MGKKCRKKFSKLFFITLKVLYDNYSARKLSSVRISIAITIDTTSRYSFQLYVHSFIGLFIFTCEFML